MKLQWFKTLAILAILLGIYYGASAQAPKAGSAPVRPSPAVANTYRGGLVSPLLPKPKFTLTDTSGAAYDFSAKTQGYVTLLFFGYTNCPDMCPLQMHMIADASQDDTPGCQRINSKSCLSPPIPTGTVPRYCGAIWITSTNALSA